MSLKGDGKRRNLKRRGDNRSDRHIRYQVFLADLLREYGYHHVEIEKPMPYNLPLQDERTLRIRYRLDCYGRDRDRQIAIEIDGYMGHKTKRSFEMDGLRRRRICETYGPIEFYRFTFKQLGGAGKWTSEEIAQEMNLGPIIGGEKRI
jgi:hypothetical protein